MGYRAGFPHGLVRRRLLIALPVAACLAIIVCAVPTARRSHHVSYPYGKPGHLKAELDKFWLNAKKEVYKSVPVLLAQNRVELQKGLRYAKLIRGDAKRKEIAITFDDGPHPQYTSKLLDILKRCEVKATFFVVGEQAERYPGLVKAELAAGHSVGNHTYHHVNLTKIPPEYVATEIEACGDVVKKIAGQKPHLFRPPGGDYNNQVAEVAETLGYTTVLWTNDPGDYASPGSRAIESRTLRTLSNGAIILIHDGIQQTIDILPDLIKRLRAKGFQFVTIDEMLARCRPACRQAAPMR